MENSNSVSEQLREDIKPEVLTVATLVLMKERLEPVNCSRSDEKCVRYDWNTFPRTHLHEHKLKIYSYYLYYITLINFTYLFSFQWMIPSGGVKNTELKDEHKWSHYKINVFNYVCFLNKINFFEASTSKFRP
jgi:hypothetical protein